MKNKLNTIIVILYFSLFFFAVIGSTLTTAIADMQLNPFDYARITDVDYKAVVVDEPNSEGKVVITERLTFDIHAASRSNPFWELWRDLCEDYVDGLRVHYKVNSVKQIMPDGSEVIYGESPKLYWYDEDYTDYPYGPGKWYHSEGPYNEDYDQYECVFFYVDGIYREKVVFEIEYEMYNAALKYNDCSDLYLALYSGSTCKHLDSFKAQILFPNKDMPSAGNYDVFTYGTNSNDFPVMESADLNPGYYTFYFDLDKDDLKFKPYNEYIEFDLVSYGKDRHIFTEYAPDNYYTYDDVLDEIYEEQYDYASVPGEYQTKKTVALVILSICSVLILAYAFSSESRIKSKNFFYKPTAEYELYRDIPSDLDPKFAATLVFSKHKQPKDDSGIYSAILLSLARKKYISLVEYGNDDIRITLNRPVPPRQPVTIQQSSFSGMQSNMGFGYNTGMNLNTGLFNTEVTAAPGLDAIASPPQEESLEPLTMCEQLYYDLLIRHESGGSIMMSYFQSRLSSDYMNTDTFLRNMNNSTSNIGINQGYFQKMSYNQPRKSMESSAGFLLVLGIIFIALVNLISNFTRMDLAFGGYTLLGIACIGSSIFLKIRARKYILLTQYGEDEYAKWRGLYNFLNSETLINERTIVELPLWEKYLVYATAFGLSEKVIKAIGIRCPEASNSDSSVLSGDYYRSRSFHRRSGRSFRSSVRTGSSIARSGGGSFGYGGGGRGGGGGGGGH